MTEKTFNDKEFAILHDSESYGQVLVTWQPEREDDADIKITIRFYNDEMGANLELSMGLNESDALKTWEHFRTLAHVETAIEGIASL